MPNTEKLLSAARLQYKRAVLWSHARRGDLVCRLMLHEHLADPYPLYEDIRAAGPVYRSRAGVQAVTAHELCGQVLRDSAFGRRNEDTGTAEPAGDGPRAGDDSRAGGGNSSFLEGEVADHMRWRRLVAPAFRTRKIAEYRHRTEEVAHRLLDAALDRGGEFDLVTDFASPCRSP